MGEFGFAPQKIQTKDDYASSTGAANKRKFERPSDGPIPGDPVLRGLLKPTHDKAAVRILKSMGWRANQGVGSRLTYNQKRRENERNRRELYRQKDIENVAENDDESEDEQVSDDDNITFAPDDFDPFIATFKTNLFGLGYTGLRPTELPKQNINLFGPSLQLMGKNNKKISITGQAFGVGAFEEEDDDIYGRDDMSQYDRAIDNREKALRDEENASNRQAITYHKKSSIEGFNESSTRDCSVKVFEVELSRNFVPRNWMKRRTRFEPLRDEKKQELVANSSHKILGLGRHDLKPEDRMRLLGDEPSTTTASTEPVQPPKTIEFESSKPAESDSTSANLTKLSELQEKNATNVTGGKFRPFALNEAKQARYEKFLEFKSSDPVELESFFADIQPMSMSKFEREMERNEFKLAKRMYKPLDDLMSSRFVKECDLVAERVEKEEQEKKEPKKITRTRSMWKPHKELCKRFNVPEPFGGMMYDFEEEKEQKKKKESKSLFDYIGVNINSKRNFEMQQVIPKNFVPDEKEKPRQLEPLRRVPPPKPPQENVTFKEVMEPVKPLKLPEPSNELEKKVAESIDKKPEEKKELFKAIFCDDSDDEEEEEEKQRSTSSSANQKITTLIENFIDPKAQTAFMRNDDKPQGIFKNIFEITREISMTTAKPTPPTPTETTLIIEGPMPPPTSSAFSAESSRRKSTDSSSTSESELDRSLFEKLKKSSKSKKEKKKKKSRDVVEEWVEAEKADKKKHKREKKKKKHKSKK